MAVTGWGIAKRLGISQLAVSRGLSGSGGRVSQPMLTDGALILAENRSALIRTTRLLTTRLKSAVERVCVPEQVAIVAVERSSYSRSSLDQVVSLGASWYDIVDRSMGLLIARIAAEAVPETSLVPMRISSGTTIKP